MWAVRSLQHGAANMYVLISLGTNAAYIYSVFAMIYYRVRLLMTLGILLTSGTSWGAALPSCVSL